MRHRIRPRAWLWHRAPVGRPRHLQPAVRATVLDLRAAVEELDLGRRLVTRVRLEPRGGTESHRRHQRPVPEVRKRPWQVRPGGRQSSTGTP